ncbi:unnamed protein product [marine sediment metagenome]|uniref:Uncharacterized protein n=1 Tax=marine sediment metagenome TaxID=412755 RepID=X0UR57_9ZZZZ
MKLTEIADKVFREYYVPLYPKDKPISEMTPYEQGLHKQVFLLVDRVITILGEQNENNV